MRLRTELKLYLKSLETFVEPTDAKSMQENIIEELSPRELQVFILYGTGNSLPEVAFILCISKKTVSTLRENIKLKTGIKNKYQIMSYCVRAEMYNEDFITKFI